jgi:hypothetical protein
VRAESRLGTGTTIEVRFPEAAPLGPVTAPPPRTTAAAG